MNLDCVWLTKLSMFCRYEVRCSLCKGSIASKLDTIEKHEQSEKHVEMLGNQRTCIFRGDAGHRIAQAKLHAARLKHDRGTARQMALLLHLSSKGRPMQDYPAQKKLQQHLLTDILVGVPDKLEDVAKSHIRTLVDEFMSLSLDEASQHNISVLSVHAYIINDKWKRIPLFLEVSMVMCCSAT